MKEIFEYKNIESDLESLAGNPNFSDQERSWADELWTSLKNTDEPTSKEYRKRIEEVENYLKCGVIHESETIMDILKGK